MGIEPEPETTMSLLYIVAGALLLYLLICLIGTWVLNRGFKKRDQATLDALGPLA